MGIPFLRLGAVFFSVDKGIVMVRLVTLVIGTDYAEVEGWASGMNTLYHVIVLNSFAALDKKLVWQFRGGVCPSIIFHLDSLACLLWRTNVFGILSFEQSNYWEFQPVATVHGAERP